MATALLIDDDPARRAGARALLLNAGLTVFEGEVGGDVAAQARTLRPNLVALGLGLAGGDVGAVCGTLKADPTLVGTAVIVVVGGKADADEGMRIAEALAGGADDVLAADEVAVVAANRIGRLLHFHRLSALAILNEQLAQVGRLVAGIVHEIRAPLTVIRGNAELMALDLGQDHAAGVWFRPILRNARTLQTRLEHLMAAVRMGPSRPRALDVVPLVAESINLFEKGIDTCRGHIKIDLAVDSPDGPLPPALVDPGRLIQVVLNLLANAHDAIVGDRADGRIEVKIKAMAAEGEVQIDVHDDGPGVGAGFLDRIFEPFFTTKTGGTGYGLYLAAEILREHGGRLAACNPDGGGACFSIHLPIAPPAEEVGDQAISS